MTAALPLLRFSYRRKRFSVVYVTLPWPKGLGLVKVFVHVSPGLTARPGRTARNWSVPGGPRPWPSTSAEGGPEGPPPERISPVGATLSWTCWVVVVVVVVVVVEPGTRLPVKLVFRFARVRSTVVFPLASTDATSHVASALLSAFMGSAGP